MDAWIEVMDLVGECVEVGDPDKDINSNETERTDVDLTVCAHNTSTHEAHVGVVGQASWVVRPAGSRAQNVCNANPAGEVRDQRRLGAWPGKLDVERCAV